MFQKQAWMQRAGEYPQTDREYFALLARAVFSAGLGPKVVESRWKDMGEAFAADQLVQRMWDGPAPSNEERRWIAEATERLATRYDLDIPQSVPALLQEWRASGRGVARDTRDQGGGFRRRR